MKSNVPFFFHVLVDWPSFASNVLQFCSCRNFPSSQILQSGSLFYVRIHISLSLRNPSSNHGQLSFLAPPTHEYGLRVLPRFCPQLSQLSISGNIALFLRKHTGLQQRVHDDIFFSLFSTHRSAQPSWSSKYFSSFEQCNLAYFSVKHVLVHSCMWYQSQLLFNLPLLKSLVPPVCKLHSFLCWQTGFF